MHTHPSPSGFTLIELMVVIVILGLLGTMVGVNVIGNAEHSRREVASTQVRTHFSTAQGYYLRYSKLPDPLSVLTTPDPETGEPMLLTLEPDPWGGAYRLIKGHRPARFAIASDGPDRIRDTEDDIVFPPPEAQK